MLDEDGHLAGRPRTDPRSPCATGPDLEGADGRSELSYPLRPR
jgi:hypothetical protein